MKIFNLSFPRCATSSTHKILCAMGFASIHLDPLLFISYGLGQPLNWRNVHAKDAFSDVPFSIPAIYRECLKMYPGAKFILCTRPVEDWMRSIEALWRLNSKPHLTWSNLVEGNPSTKVNRDTYGSSHFDHTIWSENYQERIAQIKKDLSGVPDQLLVLDLTESDEVKAEKLACFVGRGIPGHYPRENVQSVGNTKIW